MLPEPSFRSPPIATVLALRVASLPAKTSTSPVPRACAEAATSVPPNRSVPPEKELSPESVSAPAPNFARLPS